MGKIKDSVARLEKVLVDRNYHINLDELAKKRGHEVTCTCCGKALTGYQLLVPETDTWLCKDFSRANLGQAPTTETFASGFLLV